MHPNLALFNLLHQFAGRSRLLDGAGFFLADTLTYFIVLGFLVLALSFPGARRKIFAIGEMLLAFLVGRGIITSLIHALWFHARPFVTLNFTPLIPTPVTEASFPSGHMAGLFAVSFVAYRLNKKWGWAAFILSLIVGVARIYAGVHWPTDILAGIVVGLAAGWFTDRLARQARLQLFNGSEAGFTGPSPDTL